jgi:hypothetical protein
VLRRILGTERRGRTLNDEEFHNYYSSTNITRMIKSRRKR